MFNSIFFNRAIGFIIIFGMTFASMELSHEPLDLSEGGKAYVMRWPGDHARVDPRRNVDYEYLNDEDYNIGGTGR